MAPPGSVTLILVNHKIPQDPVWPKGPKGPKGPKWPKGLKGPRGPKRWSLTKLKLQQLKKLILIIKDSKIDYNQWGTILESLIIKSIFWVVVTLILFNLPKKVWLPKNKVTTRVRFAYNKMKNWFNN